MILFPPISTLFPYTTLFRSIPLPPVRVLSSPPVRQKAEAMSHQVWVVVYPYEIEEHTSELQSRFDLVCRLLLEKKKKIEIIIVMSDLSLKQYHSDSTSE